MGGVRSYGEDVSEPFVPTEFEVPLTFNGPGFHLEPLGPVHNERDYQAWMSSIEHIKATPGMDWKSWPIPMTLKENMADMEMHAKEFTDRENNSHIRYSTVTWSLGVCTSTQLRATTTLMCGHG